MKTDSVTPQEAAGAGSSPSSCSLSTWWRRYRIMPDSYGGHEVQVWRIWLPIWLQLGFVNTFHSREDAVKFATRHAKPDVL